MKIKIGEWDLYESGSLILIENQPLIFYFENSLFRQTQIIFSDAEATEKFKFAHVDNDNNLELTIPKKIQKGIPQYLQIGVAENRELLFNFHVSEIDHKSKLFHYTFLLGKEIVSKNKK